MRSSSGCSRHVHGVPEYARYVAVLKWLCLSLFAYVATVLIVQVPWGEAISGILVPSIELQRRLS